MIFSNIIGQEPEFSTFKQKVRGCFDNFELKKCHHCQCVIQRKRSSEILTKPHIKGTLEILNFLLFLVSYA
jgi:hypothetical protein